MAGETKPTTAPKFMVLSKMALMYVASLHHAVVANSMRFITATFSTIQLMSGL